MSHIYLINEKAIVQKLDNHKERFSYKRMNELSDQFFPPLFKKQKQPEPIKSTETQKEEQEQAKLLS